MPIHSSPTVRLAAFALIATTVAAAPRDRATTVDGWSITQKSTSTSAQASATTRMRVIPDKARIDFSTPQPGTSKGSYMLIEADQARMIMVSPEDKAAVIFPVGGMMSALGAVANSPLMKMEVSDVSVTVDDLGSGEAILGRSTHKYRMREQYTIKVSAMMMKRTMKTEATTEMWVTRDIPAADQRAFEELSKSLTASIGGQGFGGEGMAKLMREMQAKMPKGFPLKQVRTSTDTDDKGKPTTSTTTTEVTEFARGSFDASLFEIPKGYEISDMTQVMNQAADAAKQQRQECEKQHGAAKCDSAYNTNVDSLMRAAADSSKEAQKQGAKNAATEAAVPDAMKKLGGFLNRKKKDAKPDSTKKP